MFFYRKRLMKPTKSINQLSDIINQNLGVHKNNCKTVIDFVLAMQKSRTANMGKMVNYSIKIGDILPESIYRSFQRIVSNTTLSQSELAKCIITMYDLNDCKLTLAIDRTNWRYGESDINLLVLSVCVLGCTIPLYWIELDSRGNSNTETRKKLIKMLTDDFGVERIEHIVADREFIGNDWFEHLDDITKFVIRIKGNTLLALNGESIVAQKLFKSVNKGGMISYEVKIDGIMRIAQATRSADNELVIVVSNDFTPCNLLVIYAQRWKIECLFGHLKKRGFNFEDTHIVAQDRIGNLTKFVVLSFAICYLIGLVGASIKPILVKKHGYKQNSFFRYGYDLMVRLLNLNLRKALQIVILCFSKINLEEKCRRLKCVM